MWLCKACKSSRFVSMKNWSFLNEILPWGWKPFLISDISPFFGLLAFLFPLLGFNCTLSQRIHEPLSYCILTPFTVLLFPTKPSMSFTSTGSTSFQGIRSMGHTHLSQIVHINLTVYTWLEIPMQEERPRYHYQGLYWLLIPHYFCPPNTLY